MKKTLWAVFVAAVMPVAAFAGVLDEAAGTEFTLNGPVVGFALPELELPPPEVAVLAAQRPDAAWLMAVKRVYNTTPIGNLPPAQLSELPSAALQQMQEDAQVYPSRAYKIIADGLTAYVIENDNLDALYVNIFDVNGAHIAFGGFDENYDFWWLPPSARAVEELSTPEYCRINDRDLNALAEGIMTKDSPRDPVTRNLYLELEAAGPGGKPIKARIVNVRHSHPGDQFHIEVYAAGKLLFKSGRQDNPVFIGFQVDDVPFSLTCFEDIRGGKAPFPVNTDPYIADQASEVIFNWLSSDSGSNMQVLKDWMAANGVQDSVTEFIYHKKHAVKRAEFARTLQA